MCSSDLGDRSQVFRMEIGGRGQPGSLDLPTASAREVGQYHVQLIQQPRTLVAGREAHLAFRLERAGQPVLDLEPYIGALGHCVVISEDTQTYLHSHPEQFTPTPPPHGGPVVAFHTTFPRPGRYKVWGQFRRGTEIIVADFVVEVKAPLIPQWIQTAFLND